MSDYNGGNNGGNFQPRPKTSLNNRHLTMWAPNGEGKNASMAFDIKKNDTTIIVRTNAASDAANNHGRIVAEVPTPYFYTIMEMLKKAALSDIPVRWCYEHKDRKFIGQGKMTDGPVLHHRIIVGRGEDGVVYLSVTQEKRPNIKFTFLNDNKSNFKDNDGNEMPKALESTFVTLGRVSIIEKLMAIHLDRAYKHPEQKPQGGGNGGGGYNNNRGGQGGNSSYGGSNANAGGGGADMRSEDIPW